MVDEINLYIKIIYSFMKYLKTFESLTDYKVEVLTTRKIREIYDKLYPNNTRKYRDFNLKDKIF